MNKIDFINKEIYDVVLSLDGRKEINDRFRLTKTGAGSYDLVLQKFKKLVEKRGNKQYYVRGTYTKNNLDFSEDVMHLYDLGFSDSHWIWMFIECGCVGPNISKIMKTCPIDFSDEDEPEVTLQKINKFFLEQYKKYRYGNKK